ncbi:MAG TPA: hypothetical protein VH796_01350 [Nitrososphaeraceae archaeon]|jgi:riboflavin biosynthesis pyrimidine reductase
MSCQEIFTKYIAHLEFLAERNQIGSDQLNHFLHRGIEVISPSKDFGLESLGKILPEIVIGANSEYISKLKVPYQATSYLAANAMDNNDVGPYVYKISSRKAGGVPFLTGGKRRQIDNAFASTHRILMGRDAIMVSADNLMLNKENIWNWHFFGDFFRESDPNLFKDLCELETRIGKTQTHRYVIVARSDKTFKRLHMKEEYEKNRIAVLDKQNDIHVIFVTNESGYLFARNSLPESAELSYIVTGKDFDFRKAMRTLREEYHILKVLNDGGRQMSNGVLESGLLGEERVTLEPYPGDEIMHSNKEIDQSSILGKKGLGIDGSELAGAVLLHSIGIGKERANVYTYPLNDEIVL